MNAHALSPDQLDEIRELINDQEFNTTDFRYLQNKGELRIRFTRELPEIIVSKSFFITYWKAPVVEAFLTIRNVESYNVNERDHIGEDIFRDIDYSTEDRVVTLYGVGSVTVSIAVTGLDVECVDTGAVVWERHGRTYLGIFQIYGR